MTGIEHRRALPAAPASAGAARQFLDSVLSGPEVAGVAYVGTMLISELVTNAVLHGRPPVEVVVKVAGPLARVEVHDGSPRLPVRKNYSTMSGTGRGLLLVETMAAGWGAELTAGGKVVWFELDGSAPAMDVFEVDAR